MTIGIDISPALRENKTGVEWYVYHCVREMLNLQTQHTFLLYTDRRDTGGLFTSYPNATVHHLKWSSKFFWSEVRLSYEMLKNMPDVLFVPGRGLPLIHPKKTITAIHDLGFYEHNPYRSHKRIEYLKWSNQFAISHVSHIITFAEFTKQEMMRRYKISENTISIIPHSYDKKIFHGSYSYQEVDEFLASHGLKKPYIVAIGRIDGRKNITRLIEAFKKIHSKHKEFSLVLAGPLGFFGNEIKKSWEASTISREIHYLSWISEYDKALLLQGADCFVFPTLYEGFGIPILEAQGSGVPVVCSSTTSLPEVAGKDAAVFFDPYSDEDMAEKIIYCITHPQERQLLIEHGKVNIERFSWQRAAQETLKILES